MNTGTNKTDIAISIAKGIIGIAPIIGPLTAEVVSNLIPNQRIDRIEKFLKVLNDKVEQLDQERLRIRFQEPGFIDLLEDGFYQAARALTPERIEYIAILIKNSLTEDDIKSTQQKMMLSLLGEMNDIEVILLCSYVSRQEKNAEFREKHKAVLARRIAYVGASQEQIDDAIIFESYQEHLVRLGLVQKRFQKPKKDGIPEFDEKTGMMKASTRAITSLWRIMLRYMDFV